VSPRKKHQPQWWASLASDPRALKIAVALALVVAFAFALAAAVDASSDANHSRVVVFDAGSTGNRVHVFKFSSDVDGVTLVSETFAAKSPGFRDLASKGAKVAADSLDALIDVARDEVPAKMRSRTKLTLRATAGIRLLPEGAEAAEAIMRAARKKLMGTGFDVEDRRVSVMSGEDEGKYAWTSVNYLLGRVGVGKSFENGGGGAEDGTSTVAVLDLGGGSAQIAFAVSDAAKASAPPGKGYVQSVGDGGRRDDVYVKSFAGYGLMAARAKVLATGGDDEDSGGNGTHPCVPAGYVGGCEENCYGLAPGERRVLYTGSHTTAFAW
jgi:apyrase